MSYFYTIMQKGAISDTDHLTNSRRVNLDVALQKRMKKTSVANG